MNEQLVRVDTRDRVLGPFDRALHNKYIHRGGAIFLFNSKDEMLVQKRSAIKTHYPNFYDCSVSFQVRYNESYEQAAARELQEELGIAAPLRKVGKYKHFDTKERQFVTLFECRYDGPIEIDKNELESVQFMATPQIIKLLKTDKVAPWFRLGWQYWIQKRP